MSLQEIKKFLLTYPSYLKVGPDRLSDRLNCGYEMCRIALDEVRYEMRVSENENQNENSAGTDFKRFLGTNEINPDKIESVKFWQTQKGDSRFSVVTREQDSKVNTIREEIEEFASMYSPKVPKIQYEPLNNPVALEISLPDIHYGKLSGMTLEETENEFLYVISALVKKSSGLNIEQFLLPIGNDGLNSEGLRQTTTKGTPQQDSAGWKETFTGYWNLIVRAIDMLKPIAPVDVVVVSGNHDYERMYYIGDVISGWYRNDPNVTVDNGKDSRKYWSYGTNLLMFTHGDNEKPHDMPLIMATEQPELFAKATHREAHCGHFHKEQVNEYRGVKIRFIPSICPSDEWHKKMGYSAKRTGQAYVWNKSFGLEGYVQHNIT